MINENKGDTPIAEEDVTTIAQESLQYLASNVVLGGEHGQPLNTSPAELSLGEELVGIKFNPSDDSQVALIKQKMAEIANICADVRVSSYVGNLIKGDALRCILHAQMAAVKLVTLKY